MNQLEKTRPPRPEINISINQPKLGELAIKCAGCPFKRMCEQAPAPNCEAKTQQIISGKENLKKALMDDSVSSIHIAGDGGGYVATRQAKQAELVQRARDLAIPRIETPNPRPLPKPKQNTAPKAPIRPVEKKNSRPSIPSILESIEKSIYKAISK